MKKILLVDDERNFAMVMKDYLRLNGFDVTLCADGTEGLAAFTADRFAACIVDVMMPRMDGFSLVKEIRARDGKVPVIFLTARGMRDDMMKGYVLGCDDYVVKPFDAEILLMKIRAVIARSGATQQELYRIGKFTFHVSERQLADERGSKRRLSPKEAALLQMLCENRNSIVSRADALKRIWKEDNYFNGRSMDVYIARLRKHLEAASGVRIENLHGSGYALKDAEIPD